MKSRRRRLEAGEEDSTVKVSLVAINELVSAVQGLIGQKSQNESNEEKMEKPLTDKTYTLSKVADALHRLKSVIKENAREERRLEEK